jgi:hypothetical protein
MPGDPKPLLASSLLIDLLVLFFHWGIFVGCIAVLLFCGDNIYLHIYLPSYLAIYLI